MSDNLKKLTGKNPKDFEPAACSLINNSDVNLFKELVEHDDFLFDFVKQNVSSRLEKQCNSSNYLNLLNFLKYYSPSYEEFIVSTLVRFADEDLTDKMLELLENGTDDEKTYCAKFFTYIQDPLAVEILRKYAYSENSCLSYNSVSTLAAMNDKEIYNDAIKKLNSDDEFEKLKAVKLLVSYGDKNAASLIIQTMKKSPLAENMAIELPYLIELCELSQDDELYVLNLITDSLGEIASLSQVFDFNLYEIYSNILRNSNNSKNAVVLLNAKNKFETLTENNEYLYDESKDVKQEVYEIKKLFDGDFSYLKKLADEELKENSDFVFTALELTTDANKTRELLNCHNQTIILKSVEVLKKLNALSQSDKETALNNVSDENIRNIIKAQI